VHMSATPHSFNFFSLRWPLQISGCRTGVGQGKMLSSGVSGGGGHGGKGGDGLYNGSHADGGATYGNADLPCELGSGSGNATTQFSTAGGGIIGITFSSCPQFCLIVCLNNAF